MNTHPPVKADERTAAVAYKANTWGLNFILYALLLDIMYRSVVLHEASWDLFALIGLTGVVSVAYMARQKVLSQVFGWKVAILMAAGALVAGVVSAILAMAKAM